MANLKHAVALGVMALALASCDQMAGDPGATIERNILDTPGQEELWLTIKQEYPRDFAQLVSEIESLQPSQRRDNAIIERLGAEWLQGFFATISPDAVRAPAPQLLAWSEAEHALYASLQDGAVSQCARLTMGDWITVDPEDAAITAAIARRNAAMVRSASAGRQSPVEYADPAEDALRQLGNAIAQTGLDPQLQASLGSTEAMEALDAAQQCEVGVAVYAGLTALPDDAEPLMAAYMLAPK